MGERRGRCKGGIEWIVPREKYLAGLCVGRFVMMHDLDLGSLCSHWHCQIIEQIKSVITGFKFKENNFKTWL